MEQNLLRERRRLCSNPSVRPERLYMAEINRQGELVSRSNCGCFFTITGMGVEDAVSAKLVFDLMTDATKSLNPDLSNL